MQKQRMDLESDKFWLWWSLEFEVLYWRFVEEKSLIIFSLSAWCILVSELEGFEPFTPLIDCALWNHALTVTVKFRSVLSEWRIDFPKENMLDVDGADPSLSWRVRGRIKGEFMSDNLGQDKQASPAPSTSFKVGDLPHTAPLHLSWFYALLRLRPTKITKTIPRILAPCIMKPTWSLNKSWYYMLIERKGTVKERSESC